MQMRKSCGAWAIMSMGPRRFSRVATHTYTPKPNVYANLLRLRFKCTLKAMGFVLSKGRRRQRSKSVVQQKQHHMTNQLPVTLCFVLSVMLLISTYSFSLYTVKRFNIYFWSKAIALDF